MTLLPLCHIIVGFIEAHLGADDRNLFGDQFVIPNQFAVSFPSFSGSWIFRAHDTKRSFCPPMTFHEVVDPAYFVWLLFRFAHHGEELVLGFIDRRKD